MDNSVFLLQHAYEYGDENEHTECKDLGMYSSYENAVNARERYMKLEGFCDYPEDCFYISTFSLDVDKEWREGFFEA